MSNFEDKCDECNLAYCFEHIPDHDCGCDPAGSSSSTFVRPVPRCSPALHSSSATSNLFSTPLQVIERESDAVAKRRKLVQPTIDVAEIRLKWGPEEEIKEAKHFKLEVYDGKSWLWDHFKRLTKRDAKNSDQSYEAACNICYDESKTKSDIKWTVFYNKSTTKLSRHLELCQKSICVDRSKESAKTLLSSGEKTMTAFLCSGAHDDHLYRVLKMCIKMCLPISMCENGAFISELQFPNHSVNRYQLNACYFFDDQTSWKD